MGVGYNPRIVTDGLVLCVDAANKRSYPGTGTTLTDIKGDSNGTLVNGATFSDDNGGGIVFDGTNDYITFGQTSLSVQGPATIDIWASYSSTNGNRNLAALTAGTAMTQIGVRSNGVVWKSGGYALITYTTPTIGQSANWIVTVDGSNFNVYIDGSLNNSTTSASTPTGANGSFWLGTFNGIGEFHQGSIYSARVYNRVLSASEARQNFEATKGRYE